MDAEDAFWTVILAPFVTAIFVGMFAIVYHVFAATLPRVDGPFSGAADSLWYGFVGAFNLIQIGSSIEYVIAIIVIILAVGGYFISLASR